jgi:hypothetical protein
MNVNVNYIQIWTIARITLILKIDTNTYSSV